MCALDMRLLQTISIQQDSGYLCLREVVTQLAFNLIFNSGEQRCFNLIVRQRCIT